MSISPWIKLEHTTPDKPEFVRMAARLRMDQDAIVGKAIRFWVYCDQHGIAGDAMPITEKFIDKLVGKRGFAAALREVGWLDGNDGALIVTHFDRHNGQTAKARCETNRRVAEHRKNTASNKNRKAITSSVKAEVLLRDGGECVYCKRKIGHYKIGETPSDAALSLDHVIPLSLGGSDTAQNIATSCLKCNMIKSDRTPDQAGLPWPKDANGKKLGVTNVTKNMLQKPLPEEEEEEDIGLRENSARGLPANHAEAIRFAGPQMIPDDFIRTTFDQCEAVGWVDTKQRAIVNWPSYLAKSWAAEKQRQANGPKRGGAVFWQRDSGDPGQKF